MKMPETKHVLPAAQVDELREMTTVLNDSRTIHGVVVLTTDVIKEMIAVIDNVLDDPDNQRDS